MFHVVIYFWIWFLLISDQYFDISQNTFHSLSKSVQYFSNKQLWIRYFKNIYYFYTIFSFLCGWILLTTVSQKTICIYISAFPSSNVQYYCLKYIYNQGVPLIIIKRCKMWVYHILRWSFHLTIYRCLKWTQKKAMEQQKHYLHTKCLCYLTFTENTIVDVSFILHIVILKWTSHFSKSKACNGKLDKCLSFKNFVLLCFHLSLEHTVLFCWVFYDSFSVLFLSLWPLSS